MGLYYAKKMSGRKMAVARACERNVGIAQESICKRQVVSLIVLFSVNVYLVDYAGFVHTHPLMQIVGWLLLHKIGFEICQTNHLH